MQSILPLPIEHNLNIDTIAKNIRWSQFVANYTEQITLFPALEDSVRCINALFSSSFEEGAKATSRLITQITTLHISGLEAYANKGLYCDYTTKQLKHLAILIATYIDVTGYIKSSVEASYRKNLSFPFETWNNYTELDIERGARVLQDLGVRNLAAYDALAKQLVASGIATPFVAAQILSCSAIAIRHMPAWIINSRPCKEQQLLNNSVRLVYLGSVMPYLFYVQRANHYGTLPFLLALLQSNKGFSYAGLSIDEQSLLPVALWALDLQVATLQDIPILLLTSSRFIYHIAKRENLHAQLFELCTYSVVCDEDERSLKADSIVCSVSQYKEQLTWKQKKRFMESLYFAYKKAQGKRKKYLQAAYISGRAIHYDAHHILKKSQLREEMLFFLNTYIELAVDEAPGKDSDMDKLQGDCAFFENLSKHCKEQITSNVDIARKFFQALHLALLCSEKQESIHHTFVLEKCIKKIVNALAQKQTVLASVHWLTLLLPHSPKIYNALSGDAKKMPLVQLSTVCGLVKKGNIRSEFCLAAIKKALETFPLLQYELKDGISKSFPLLFYKSSLVQRFKALLESIQTSHPKHAIKDSIYDLYTALSRKDLQSSALENIASKYLLKTRKESAAQKHGEEGDSMTSGMTPPSSHSAAASTSPQLYREQTQSSHYFLLYKELFTTGYSYVVVSLATGASSASLALCSKMLLQLLYDPCLPGQSGNNYISLWRRLSMEDTKGWPDKQCYVTAARFIRDIAQSIRHGIINKREEMSQLRWLASSERRAKRNKV